ncbi:hypothetical protein BUCNMO_283 [Buchnera aphidicola (Nipponaphis monzeni)]|uniref:tRNA uridine(34) hydroxylase n=1 Tax=Buchnera aphidicola (Nipponaphis monzeni) TaxID=2495405 RepID=A0A455TAD0_9GAMM|nr:rhodanese-related sulfurtransferase [Buchnera aphidicola]BBI01288.1 hypothetical protein BUCNMO_283 [Buchnera aphidicola (Nipponaphis monzeni)]
MNSLYLQKNNRITVSFYKYFFIADPKILKNTLLCFFKKTKTLGRIYISQEGINAQISVLKNYFLKIKNFIYTLHIALKNVLINISLDNTRQSFVTLKIKVRKNIVNDGIVDINFNPNIVGKYLDASTVNKMFYSNDSIFVDIRNSYEYAIGHFKNSINILSKTFRQQIPKLVPYLNKFKKNNIILYCTGGIRCEKTTAWMLYNHFKNVYHIRGGIIGYVNEAKKNNLSILFKGKNFVFDLRMYETISNDCLGTCLNCKKSYDFYINCKNKKCNLLFIQCPCCFNTLNGYCSLKCMYKNFF